MIGYLKGLVVDASEDRLILDVNGVGYEVSVSPTARERARLRENTSLFVYTHVREDALVLFGFETQVEKNLFLSLLKVNGVGPKMAMAIVSSAPSDRLMDWIQTADVKALAKLPKVGKKTAEQIVLTLQGQLVRQDVTPPSSSVVARDEITSALIHLGFRPADVDRVVELLPKGLDFDEGLRKGLSLLSGGASLGGRT